MRIETTQRPSKAQERKFPGLTAAVEEVTRKRCVTCNQPLGWGINYVLHGETASEHEHAVCYYTRCDRDLQVSWVARITAEPGRRLLCRRVRRGLYPVSAAGSGQSVAGGLERTAIAKFR